MPRAEAEKMVKSLGGRPSSSVSKSTDFVVVGEDPGSKYAKAQQLGVTILTEEEFRRMVGRSRDEGDEHAEWRTEEDAAARRHARPSSRR